MSDEHSLTIPDLPSLQQQITDLANDTAYWMGQAGAMAGEDLPAVHDALALAHQSLAQIHGQMMSTLAVLQGMVASHREAVAQRDQALAERDNARLDADTNFWAGWDAAREDGQVRNEIINEAQIEEDEKAWSDGRDYGKKEAERLADAELSYVYDQLAAVEKARDEAKQIIAWYEGFTGLPITEIVPTEPGEGA